MRRKWWCFTRCGLLGVAALFLSIIGLGLAVAGGITYFNCSTSSFVDSYNSVVQDWDSTYRPIFEGQNFKVCETVSGACAQLYEERTSEGAAPSRDFASYTPLVYKSYLDTKLFTTRRFECTTNTVFRFHLYNGDIPFSDQPFPIPAFAWVWSSYNTSETCEAAFGLWLPDPEECLLVSMLDDVCITVAPGPKNWGVSPYSGSRQSSFGCRLTPPTVMWGCGYPPGNWSMGAYTQVNGTAIREQEVPMAALMGAPPSNIPISNWKGNFSAATITLRLINDPALYVEKATGGLLDIDTINTGRCAHGNMEPFFALCLFIVGIIFVTGTPILLGLIWFFFPNVWNRYVFRMSSRGQKYSILPAVSPPETGQPPSAPPSVSPSPIHSSLPQAIFDDTQRR